MLTPNRRADKGTPLLLRRRDIVADAAVADAGSAPSDEPSSAGTSTFLQAVLNVMNILMGVGLLSIPYALKEAGWVGLGVLAVLGLITNYSGEGPFMTELYCPPPPPPPPFFSSDVGSFRTDSPPCAMERALSS